MVDKKRLGLGCMGMNLSNRERAIETVHYALDNGITLLNTGEFYGGGESEMVLREALSGIPRDKYYLSVKFGVLPQPGGGIYGLDVKPFHVKAHLAYSLHRLGLDYIDLYQPARMDESIPVEELVGALEECVQAGYVRHIGLTQLSPQNLSQAAKVHPIKMVELDYSLANRVIERNGMLETARENGIEILAFGVLAHGLLSDAPAGNVTSGRPEFPLDRKEALLSEIQEFAKEKNTTVENLAQAYVYAKHPDIGVLIGTTRKEHLRASLDALSLELSVKDVKRIEEAFPEERASGLGMRNFRFRDGIIERGTIMR